MTTTKNSRNTRLTGDQSLIAGVQKFLGTYASLFIGSTKVTPADIVKVLQERIDASNAVLTADAARAAAVKEDRGKRAETTAFVQSLRRTVQGMFTQSPDTLATFGLKAPKPHKLTVATKATALAKIRATRTARGTLGSKQKKKVKGTVAPTAPATPPAASTPVTQSPAASAPSQGTGSAAPPHTT